MRPRDARFWSGTKPKIAALGFLKKKWRGGGKGWKRLAEGTTNPAGSEARKSLPKTRTDFPKEQNYRIGVKGEGPKPTQA